MKYAFPVLLLLAYGLSSCTDDDIADCPFYKEGDNIVLGDGSIARLAGIYDNRCPCLRECFWEGYLGLTITLGNDTILKNEDVFGERDNSDTISPLPSHVYLTNRGDTIRIQHVSQPENSCDGTVPGKDFCLQLDIR